MYRQNSQQGLPIETSTTSDDFSAAFQGNIDNKDDDVFKSMSNCRLPRSQPETGGHTQRTPFR